jgi:hypothetical protein
LGYFLGLVGIYQIEVDFSIIYPQRGDLTDMREILKSAQEKLKLSFEADPKLKDSEQAKKFAMHFGANIEVEVPKLEKFDR